jgi:phosphoribosyl-ATP pyrophosphohydrolase
MGERTLGVQPGDLAATIANLTRIIDSRQTAEATTSYTARLLQGPPEYALKKLVEEALELGFAFKDADHDHIRYEAADLLYHLLVVCKIVGIDWSELAGELDARMK